MRTAIPPAAADLLAAADSQSFRDRTRVLREHRDEPLADRLLPACSPAVVAANPDELAPHLERGGGR